MDLGGVKGEHQYFSGKASEVGRQLAVTGIGVIWLFSAKSAESIDLAINLKLSLALLVLALTLDLLHYVWGSIAWGTIYWWYERKCKDLTKAKSIKIFPSRWINRTTNFLFWAKLISLVVGYLILANWFIQKLLT